MKPLALLALCSSLLCPSLSAQSSAPVHGPARVRPAVSPITVPALFLSDIHFDPFLDPAKAACRLNGDDHGTRHTPDITDCRPACANIARAGFAITQAQEQEKFATGQVLTDVRDAFENLRTNDKVVGLYRSGYLDQAQQSRDISEYAYRHGAASLLDFLDAERSYRSTQLAYRQALAAYMLSLEQLKQATGTRSLP